jgi:hypothetical protein
VDLWVGAAGFARGENARERGVHRLRRCCGISCGFPQPPSPPVAGTAGAASSAGGFSSTAAFLTVGAADTVAAGAGGAPPTGVAELFPNMSMSSLGATLLATSPPVSGVSMSP